jgi:hypothetical protein
MPQLLSSHYTDQSMSPCAICGGWSGTGARFPLNTLVFLSLTFHQCAILIHSYMTNATYLSNWQSLNNMLWRQLLGNRTLSSIDYEENYILNSNSTRFLGLILDDTLSWKPHINQLCTKLKPACYIFRTLTPLLTQQNMKIIDFSNFHSVMTYGIIFGGNSVDRDNVFKLQKSAIRFITNSINRTSCRRLFKKLDILPLQSQYI